MPKGKYSMLKPTPRLNFKMMNAKSRKLKVARWSQKLKIGKQNLQFKTLEGMPSSSNKN